MKKAYRVKRNEDFQKIISKRQSLACKEFILYGLENQEGHLRVGISVSKKLGNAVVRNRIKRQVREMCRAVFSEDECYDYVVIVRNHFLEQDFQQNTQSLETISKRHQRKYQSKGGQK